MDFYIPDGAKVAYAGGINRDGLDVGDVGSVLQANGNSCHVIMRTGARMGSAVLVSNVDLTVLSSVRNDIDDSLLDGSLDESVMMRTAIRQTYDTGGEQGLIVALAESGELPDFNSAVEEAINHVASRVRSHPLVNQVLAELDEEEGANLVQTLAIAALDENLEG